MLLDSHRAAFGGWVWVATVLTLLVSTRGLGQVDTPIAVTDVRIVTGHGEVIESGTILLEGQRITAVGAAAAVVVPPEALKVDGRGLIAYPGFVDGASYLGITDAPRSEAERQRVEDERPDPREGPVPFSHAAARRGIRPDTRALELYTPSEDALTAHRKAGFTAALVTPRPGIFSGSSDLIELSDAPIRRAVIGPAVAQHASFTTGEAGDYPATLLGVFALFRQTLTDTQWLAQMSDYAARHPRTAPRVPQDAALETLGAVLARQQPLVFEANSDGEIRRALKLAEEFEIDLILSGGREAWKVADVLKARKVAVIASLRFDEEPEFGKHKPAGAPAEPPPTGVKPDATLSEEEKKKLEEERKRSETQQAQREAKYESIAVRRERRRLWEEQVSNLVRLHEAGVPFALRTCDLKSPEEFWTNLRKVMERGLPEDAVVRALSSAPAQILSRQTRGVRGDLRTQIGAIAPERLANLTLMTAPLSDAKSKVRYLFISGRRFEFEEDEAAKPKPTGDPGTQEQPAAASPPPPSPPLGPESTKPAPESVTPAQEPAEAQAATPAELTFKAETEADRVPRTRTGGNVLIRDATVIPVSGPTLPQASILVLEGKIRQIGTDVAVPDGIAVIEAAGRFVIPGFVDAHSHLGIDDINESPLAVSAEVRIEDVINPNHVGIYRALAGGTTTTHIMHGSANPIGGQCDVIKLKYRRPPAELPVPDAPPTIKFALGENVIQSNWQQAHGKRFPNSRSGVETAYRRAFEAALDYERKRTEARQARDRGQDVEPVRQDLRLEALAAVLRGDILVHCHCYRSEEIIRFLDLMEGYGVRVGVLQHVLDGYRIWPEIARHGCGASSFATSWAYKIEANEAIPHNAAVMQRHGICASVNSDSPDLIRYLGQEAAKSMRWGGLTEQEALRLVTLDAARQLRVDHRLGSLEVGKDADLAIFNGHPLNSYSKCILTLVDGEVFFEDDRPDPVADASTVPPPRPVDRRIPQPLHRAYAIIHATIHPVSGPVIDRGTVVILDERIHEVGPDAAVPPGAGVIDGTGLHVYPGLIDAGTTMTLDEIGSLRATNMSLEIGTLQPDVRAAAAVYPFNEHVRTTRGSGITTVLAVPSGQRVAGQSAVVQLDGWTARDMLLAPEFGLHLTLPVLPVRIPAEDRKKTEDEHKKRLKELEDFLEQAKHYARLLALAERDPRVLKEHNPRLAAMLPYVRRERPVVFHAQSYAAIADSLDFARRHELRPIIYGGAEAWKLADRLAREGVAVICQGPTSLPGEFEPWDSVYACAGVLDRAGVAVAFASGSADAAYTMPIDVGLAVAHGMSPQRAEHALTLGAAQILGIAERTGSIEPGKQADLVIATGPLIQAATQITHVFIRGTPVDPSNRHTENLEKFAKRPPPALPPPPNLRGPASLTLPPPAAP